MRNPEWGGDIFGNTEATLDKITFRVFADPDTSFQALEAGEVAQRQHPARPRHRGAGRTTARRIDVDILGSYHYDCSRWTTR